MTAGSIVVPHIIPIRSPQSGKAKHEIDTTTVVEIKSDTQDVTIYYTLDGSKPEVVKRPGLGESSTLKYRKPICLPDGKVAVKAVAVTRDGRESAVVTKLFLVEYVPPSQALDDKEENVPEDHELGINKQLSKETNGSIARTTGTSAESLLKPQVLGPKMNEGSSNRPPKAPRFLSSRPGLTSHVSEPTSTHTLNASLEESTFNNLTNTHISRIQRETDFLRCTKCLSLRPSDPFARFCLQCGTAVPLLPGHKLPPTEGGQLGLCIHCKTIVPMNTVACVVCEAPIGPQLQPQASLRVQDKLICQSCGTGNPAHMSFCVTCETRLAPPPTAVLSGQSAPPLPSGENKMVSCSKCNRVNHSDARFCDWCGTKPGHAASCIRCSRCGASSHPYASFCGSCGVFMEGPSRGESRVSMACSTGGAVEQEQPSTQRSDATPWQPGPPSGPFVMAPGRMEQHTQTTGLFYPSSTELHRKGQQAALELSRQDQTRDRRPLLTAISPGRGFWRKQLDHVCAHLRSYTQNNPEFRALVGEPRMGRMVSAVIEEDNYEVSLRINFVSAEQEKNRVCQGGGSEKSSGLSESQKLSSVTEGRSLLSSSHTSLGNERSGANARTSKKTNKSLSSYFLKQAPLQPTKDSQLLKEVGPDGKGQISVVQQLLDEGADPVCQGADGRPALVVAVVNGHADVIPVLVQRGADINQPSGPWNNTALHEAASMGSRGLLCAETLLGCNASIRRKNSQGLTAYEVAVSTECSPLVSLLAARMGQSMLDRLLTGAQLGLDGL